MAATSNINTLGISDSTEADVRAPAGGKLGTEAIVGIVIVVALLVVVGIIAVIVVVIFKKHHGKKVGWYSPPGRKPSDNTAQITANGIGKSCIYFAYAFIVVNLHTFQITSLMVLLSVILEL